MTQPQGQRMNSMDIFAMLQTAVLVDADDDPVGRAVGFEIINGRMRMKVVLFDELVIEDDDDPEKEDIPEDDASRQVKETDADAESNVRQLRAVGGEK